MNTNIRAVKTSATGEHVYDNEYDVDCNECGTIREVEIAIAHSGSSAMEMEEGLGGLAAKFTLNVTGMGIDETTAVYDNAYVGEYKLITMGATASNGNSSATIEAVYLCDDNVSASAQYAVRITNVPESAFDAEVTFTPYYVIEIDGEQVTICGETVTLTYNGVING